MSIKKRLISLLFALVLCMSFVIPALAESELPRVVDDANLLTDSEEKQLLSKLDEISQRQKVDVVVVTVDSLGGKSAMAYADDFYDYNGYGFGADHDGILLLVAMGTRDYWISTTGYGIKAFTDKGIDYISDKFVSYLSDAEYAKAFDTYAELADKFITQAKEGKPYDVGNMPKEPFNFLLTLIISLAIGFIAAVIVTGSMKAQLKSVRPQPAANSYIKKGSMNISNKKDMFLYRNVSKVAIPKESSSGGGSSTHTSSSGASHGGGGGKF